MATATNIVLADALATPVNHTFVPVGRDASGVMWWEDQSQASPVGFWRISASLAKPALAAPGQLTDKRFYRTKVALYEPALENITNSTVSGVAPAPQIAYQVRVNTEYVIAERASQQNRKDIRKMNYLLQNDANIIAMVENLQYLT